MKFNINANRVFGIRDIKLYGHFIEHFHRQIYGGVYDPASPLADEDGFRTDVIEAMKKSRHPYFAGPADALSHPITGKTALVRTASPCLTRRGEWKIPTASALTNT